VTDSIIKEEISRQAAKPPRKPRRFKNFALLGGLAAWREAFFLIYSISATS
jgi:hypothetical protein